MWRKSRLRRFIKELYKKISRKFYYESRYAEIFQRRINLKYPAGFNEKILWLMLHYKNPLLSVCADKYRVRGYVEKAGLGHLLARLHGVYRSSKEIDWDALPQKFALKCNHGSGYNIICKDKNALDREEAAAKLEKWLQEDYSVYYREMHYSKIKPLIVCEEYLGTKNNEFPVDYKFFCFNGVPKTIRYGYGRETQIRFEWYDTDWNPLNIGCEPNRRLAQKPPCLEEMLQAAEKLAGPFPFVRVDFYDRDGRSVFGEMTFTPCYGMSKYHNDEGDKYLGAMLKLPDKRQAQATRAD